MTTISENAAMSHPSTQTNEPRPLPAPDPRTSASSTVRMVDPYESAARSESVPAAGVRHNERARATASAS